MKNKLIALLVALGAAGGSQAADFSYTYASIDVVGISLDEPVTVAGEEREGLAGGGFDGSWAFYKDFFLRATSYSADSRSDDEDEFYEQSESSVGLGAAFQPGEATSLFVYLASASAELRSCTLPQCHITELSGARFEAGARVMVTDSLELALSGNTVSYNKDADYSNVLLAGTYYFTPHHSARVTVARNDNADSAISLGYRYNWVR